MTKKTDLDQLIPESKSVETSIGEIPLTPFTLAEFRRLGGIIAKLSAAFKIEDLTKGQIELDAQYLIYVLFEGNMDLAMTLLKVATKKEESALDQLSLPEFFEVMEAIAEICVMPAIKEAGKSLKKLQGGKKDSLGETSSSSSGEPDITTPEV